MKKLLLFTFLFTSLASLSAQQIVKGSVFDDKNNNGKKDKKEKGIANIAVSNGVEVVLTDSEGKYSLPVDDDNIIFVIKPAGYKIEVDEYNFPKSYYIHKTKGSPLSKYKGVDPTGELPESIDFALIKYDEPETFSSFIFGDSQTYTEKEVEYFTKGIVDEAKKKKGPALE